MAVARPTALEQQLHAGAPAPRATPLDAFAAARRTWLAGRRVDITQLAAEVGVSRVTLHRWVGSREKLLAEVIWSTAADTIDARERRSRARGGAKVAAVVAGFVEDVIGNPGMQRFLEDEGELALKLLTTGGAVFQPRLIARVAALLEAAAGDGFDPDMDRDELAYAIVRIAESYVYRRQITGEDPRKGDAAALLRLLLR